MHSPICEMCGSESPRLRPVTVEGSRLMLCDRCSKFGTEVKPVETRRVARPGVRPRKGGGPVESEYDLAPDYPERIRGAREAKGWKREELARRINEKLSIIEKLEKGKMRPDDRLVSRLQKALQVKLMERVVEEQTAEKSERRPVTLGDLIRRQR